MHLDEHSRLIHQPTRLQIMAHLYQRRDLAYTTLRDALGLTDGNLATHAKRLEDAGLLLSRRVLQGRDGFQLRYQITRAGSQAFRAYVQELRRFLTDGPSQTL